MSSFHCFLAAVLLATTAHCAPPLSPMSNSTRPDPLSPSVTTLRVSKRPFYNIAHMVNSIKEIDSFLAKGANAIETDIYFAPNATPIFTFHGYPCDCFRHCGERERVEMFFDRIRQLSTPSSESYNPKLVLLFLDMKLTRVEHSGKALAGQNMAALLLKHVYNKTTSLRSQDGSDLKMVISIDHVYDYDFILGFQNELENAGRGWLFREFIGWDVGLNDPMFAIDALWSRLDSIFNIWQGDGRSNCMTPFYNLARLSTVIKRRDQSSRFGPRNYIRKVYQWTIDLTVNIRTALRSKVDAIITNHPERLVNVIREREFADTFRLANKNDFPWQKVLVKAPKASAQAAAIVSPTLTLKWMNGAGDMLDSLTKYLTELLRYQTPLFFFGRFRSDSTTLDRPFHPAGTNDSLIIQKRADRRQNPSTSSTELPPTTTTTKTGLQSSSSSSSSGSDANSSQIAHNRPLNTPLPGRGTTLLLRILQSALRILSV